MNIGVMIIDREVWINKPEGGKIYTRFQKSRDGYKFTTIADFNEEDKLVHMTKTTEKNGIKSEKSMGIIRDDNKNPFLILKEKKTGKHPQATPFKCDNFSEVQKIFLSKFGNHIPNPSMN